MDYVQQPRRPDEERERVRTTVMVIDDDDQLRKAMADLLEERGYIVDSCAGGQEALGRLRAGALPDVILLDLRMPHMDGWEFRIEQRRDPNWASIPVVALSADRSPKAVAIDADAYLTKPVDERVLVETIELVVRTLDSDRRRARASELDRLHSLGALAAGIAHEVNNPLAFVLGNLELAQRKAAELEARLSGPDAFSMVGLRQLLTRAQRGAERIESVVRGVSMFASADTDAVHAVDVHEVLESSLQLASNEIRHCARLERAYESVPHVRGNPTQLGQVFLNLLLHAVRAIRACPPGDHAIRVATTTSPHRDVIVSISDTGRGLTPTLKGRIFDASFAVRSGDGLELGLSVSRELIAAMGGTIEVESELDKGSTVRVIVPSYALSLVRAPASTASARSQVRRRRPRLLVVDDEPLMCELIVAVLGATYDVATFTEPRAALASMLEGSFDLVLCDLMMPDLTGMDLHDRVAVERPELNERFVFLTGGAFTERAREFLAKTRRPQVRKPFRNQELIDVIEAQLALKH